MFVSLFIFSLFLSLSLSLSLSPSLSLSLSLSLPLSSLLIYFTLPPRLRPPPPPRAPVLGTASSCQKRRKNEKEKQKARTGRGVRQLDLRDVPLRGGHDDGVPRSRARRGAALLQAHELAVFVDEAAEVAAGGGRRRGVDRGHEGHQVRLPQDQGLGLGSGIGGSTSSSSGSGKPAAAASSTPCSLASREGRKEILRMQPAMRRTVLFVEGEGEEEEMGANDDGDEEKRENR